MGRLGFDVVALTHSILYLARFVLFTISKSQKNHNAMCSFYIAFYNAGGVAIHSEVVGLGPGHRRLAEG
jgi:hypothetical protein